MKFLIAAVALAAAAVASPTEMEARTGGNPPSGGTCNANGNNNGKVEVYCCKTSANGGLINVSLLNCVNLL
ncbi:hypothetical protein LEL_10993 [Akanthomyces lecanii RCEF 1005]|uniref:Hydrophobin n=1 Tax=Akanthomyces lecanii RCEF 1005 TaxID=1081108 RepID=A0A167NBJ9_CORDF|nr:hypothetical protein LEL_10993 [Akanthomyces lecanii RCEF 1005]